MKQEPSIVRSGQIALIALGSNTASHFGDVAETVLKASVLLGEALGVAPRLSPLYATPAFPAGAGPDFVNAALAVETAQPVEDVLALLHEVERQAGRVRIERWGPRVLDLDLIGIGARVAPDYAEYDRWRMMSLDDQRRLEPEHLILPHPRVQDRSFVLVPLADVAPDWRHPVLGLSVAQMLAARPAAERAEIVALTP